MSVGQAEGDGSVGQAEVATVASVEDEGDGGVGQAEGDGSVGQADVATVASINGVASDVASINAEWRRWRRSSGGGATVGVDQSGRGATVASINGEGRRCGRSSEGGDAAVDQWGGATLASIIAVAMGIADSQSRHRWHPSGR